MLTFFPDLLVFRFFTPTILRVTAGLVFVYLAWYHAKHRKETSHEIPLVGHEMAVWAVGVLILAELGVGVTLFLGYATQVSALIGTALSFKASIFSRTLRHLSPFSRLSYILLGVICLTLILTGGGAFAMDLPL